MRQRNETVERKKGKGRGTWRERTFELKDSKLCLQIKSGTNNELDL